MNNAVKFLLCLILAVSSTVLSSVTVCRVAGYEGLEGTALSTSKPSKEKIHEIVDEHIRSKAGSSGFFELFDGDIFKTRKLMLVKVYDEITETDTYYRVSADFRDKDTQELLTVGFNIVESLGALNITAVIIDKVNGRARYGFTDYQAPAKR